MAPSRMQIGELAKRAGVTHRTIHHYENLGLLEPVDHKKLAYHRYDEAALERLKTITALTQIGLSLTQIGDVIDLYCEDPTTIESQNNTLKTLEEHLKKVDLQAARLRIFRDKLQTQIIGVRMLRPAV